MQNLPFANNANHLHGSDNLETEPLNQSVPNPTGNIDLDDPIIAASVIAGAGLTPETRPHVPEPNWFAPETPQSFPPPNQSALGPPVNVIEQNSVVGGYHVDGGPPLNVNARNPLTNDRLGDQPGSVPAGNNDKRSQTLVEHTATPDSQSPRAIARPRVAQHVVPPRLDELNRTLGPLARKGMQDFVRAVVQESMKVAEQYAQVALMFGLAASTVTKPLAQSTPDTAEWLELQNCPEMAAWVKHLKSNSGNHSTFELAQSLQTYINGTREVIEGNTIVRHTHAAAGEELVRLLRTHGASQIFEQEISGGQANQQLVLDFFRRELNRIQSDALPNYAIFNYTVQEFAAQTLNMLCHDISNGSIGINKELQETYFALNSELIDIRNRPTNLHVYIRADGKAKVNVYPSVTTNIRDVHTNTFVARDMITTGCP